MRCILNYLLSSAIYFCLQTNMSMYYYKFEHNNVFERRKIFSNVYDVEALRPNRIDSNI